MMYAVLQSRWQEWLLLFNLDQSLGPNWDLYLITTLVGILGIVVYFRRPQPQWNSEWHNCILQVATSVWRVLIGNTGNHHHFQVQNCPIIWVPKTQKCFLTFLFLIWAVMQSLWVFKNSLFIQTVYCMMTRRTFLVGFKCVTAKRRWMCGVMTNCLKWFIMKLFKKFLNCT